MAPDAQRGHWVGIYQVWFFFGSALGSFLGGAMTDAVGYRGSLWIGAIISSIGALAAMGALVRNPIARAPHSVPIVSITRDWFRSLLESWRQVSPPMWTAILANGMNRLAAAGIISATLGLVVQQIFGSGMRIGLWQVGVASITGSILAARTVISLIGSPIAGKLSDRAQQRWGLLALSLLIGAFGMAALGWPTEIALVVGTIGSAIASGGIQTIATALIGDLSHGKPGKNLGIFYTMGDLSSAIGPLVAYALLPITGLVTLYLGCAIMLLVTAGLSLQYSNAKPELNGSFRP
jgi:MFS family permease